MSATQTATQPDHVPRRQRTDQAVVTIYPQTYRPLKELSQTTNTTMRELLDEAVTLLLLERSQPVPPELRKKFRGKVYGL